MNGNMPQAGRGGNDALREGLHETSITFDYDELLQGTRARATRIRRRRAAVAAGVALAIWPAALGVANVLPDLWDTPSPAVPAAPWQDGALPAPVEADEDGGGSNGWEIPDARPTGIGLLEELDRPGSVVNTPRTPVLDLVMTCEAGNPGRLAAEAGQQWQYGDPAGTESVSINVTGWADSPGAMHALTNADDSLACTWNEAYAPAEWDGQGGGADYFLNEAYEDSGAWVSAAAVRQGDYIVGVTVRHPDPDVAGSAAQEIADKTAGNLEVLDPTHGPD